MKRLVLIILITTLLVTLCLADSNARTAATAEDLVPVMLRCDNTFPYLTTLEQTASMTSGETASFAETRLRQWHSEAQQSLEYKLQQLASSGLAADIQPMWIANCVFCRLSESVLDEVEHTPGVSEIVLLPPGGPCIDNIDVPKRDPVAANRHGAQHVRMIDADSVWTYGFTGHGVTVALIDTGVNFAHQDLSGRMWIDPDYPNGGYDFFNDDNDPADDHGHGTMCAGLISGTGVAGIPTGVAPESRVMALKVAGADGSWNDQAILDAIQFAVDHNADIIALTLGCEQTPVMRGIYREAFQNVLAAGIIAVLPAGNRGNSHGDFPVPENIACAGDCPPPWLHEDQEVVGGLSAVITIGAVDTDDNLCQFSSIGPVTWMNEPDFYDYPFGAQIGLIKPDIVAPGECITSLDYTCDDGYLGGDFQTCGTAYSAAITAGTVALMLNKNPDLTPAQIDQILEMSAFTNLYTKRNTYGSGRIDALEAIKDTPCPTQAPGAPVDPIPANGEFDVPVEFCMHWESSFSADHYTLYLGTDNPPTNVIDGLETDHAGYCITNVVDFETQYYWRVDSHNNAGTTTGPVWSFTTVGPPYLVTDTGEIDINVPVGAGTSEYLRLSNPGGGTLEYFLDLDNTDGIQRIETSGLLCDKREFMPGQNLDIQLTLGNADESGQSISDLWLDIPTGVAWTMASHLAGGEYGLLRLDLDGSTPNQIHWHGETSDGQGVIPPGDLATGTVQIEIADTFAGNCTMPWSINTDIDGDLLMRTRTVGWMTVSATYGLIRTNETDVIELAFDGNGQIGQTRQTIITIGDNTGALTEIPVTVHYVEPSDAPDDSPAAPHLALRCAPNPFNPSTTVHWNIPEAGMVDMGVYNLRGQRVRTLENGVFEAGSHNTCWDGQNDQGHTLGSGVYFIRISNSARSMYSKVLLLK